MVTLAANAALAVSEQPSLEQCLVSYALDLTWSDLSEQAVRQAKRRLIDTVGGGIAAYAAPPSTMARRLAQPVSDGPTARVWGSLVATTPEAAAFANGTMLRYLDFNDTYRAKDGSHPSDNIGAILAVAEMVGASGRDTLLALIISYEIQCRFVDVVPFNDMGWDQPIPVVIAGALATGRLMGLDHEQMRHALALAVVANVCTYQTRAGELSMWKGCAAANGSRQAVFAARLAAEGMTGPTDPFDGVFGLWKQTVGKAYELPPLARGNAIFAVQQSNIKMYPVRDSCQLPVRTAKALREKVSAGDIASLKITTYRSAHKGAVADPELWAPKTRETADHSMLVSVASALIDGDVTPATFERERFLDKDILDLIGRTTVEISDDFTAQVPARRNCHIEAVDLQGRSHVSHMTLTGDEIEQGPSDADIERKFLSLTRALLPGKAQERLLDALRSIESCRNVSEIISLTRI